MNAPDWQTWDVVPPTALHLVSFIAAVIGCLQVACCTLQGLYHTVMIAVLVMADTLSGRPRRTVNGLHARSKVVYRCLQ